MESTLEEVVAALPKSWLPNLPLHERVGHLVDSWKHMLDSEEQGELIEAEELSALLHDAADRVKIGDSFEGNVRWSCLNDECSGHQFKVRVIYRIGNTDGQGGYRMLGVV